MIPVIFWIEFVFKFFTSKSYEFVELDDCQVKITLLWVSEILEPVSQTVVVFMSSAQSFDVEVDYETADGTAKSNEDYTPSKGKLTFKPGETVKAISIPILHDNSKEEKETIIINLKNASHGTLRDSQAYVYITDDDG